MVVVACLPADFEELQQVVELPVYVTDHCRGEGHAVHICFLHQDLLRLLAELLHSLLRDELALLEI